MEELQYSKELAEGIHRFFTENDWKYSFDENSGLFRFDVSIHGRVKMIRYHIDVFWNQFFIFADFPIGVADGDQELKSVMAEFICRANYGLSNGNFEFDMDGGMIRYKIFVDLGEGISPDKILGAGIVYSSTMFERYGDGILDILFAGASALETIEKCERKLDAKEL